MKREQLIEAATSAHRTRDANGVIRAHAAWHDLDDRGRVEAYERCRRVRMIEAALDARGLSSTGRAVLARIR